MDPPRVSIVIPCYNAAEFLPSTLASVFEQSLREIEVIVVDDGSTDDSVAVAHQSAEASDIPVRVMTIPNSGGPATPRNVGSSAALADLVLCLDADDQLTPEFVKRCVEMLDANPLISIAFTDQQDFGASTRLHGVSEYDFLTLTRRNIFGNCSVFRKQAWEDVGGFDPDMLYEDWYFFLSCGIRGHFGKKVHGVHWRYRVSDKGLYQTEYVPKDRITKAQIVRRLPGLYDAQQQAWAAMVLGENPAVDQIPNELGVIPDFPPPPDPGPIGAPLPVVERGPGSAQQEHAVSSSKPVASIVAAARAEAGSLAAALDSVLAQEGVAGRLEVIVVDDGSDDETSALLASYGERIRYVRQERTGLVQAFNSGLSLVTGEFVALLQAGDRWPPDRLARHIAALRHNANVGLVHGDTLLTDASDATVVPSLLSAPDPGPAEGRVLGRLLAGNFVAAGTATFRASLMAAWHPVPAEIQDLDWWLAAAIACVAEIRSVAGVANTRDRHRGSQGSGTAEAAERSLGDDLPWRRMLLRGFSADQTVTAADLLRARNSLMEAIRAAADFNPIGARAVLTVDHEAATHTLSRLPRAAVGALRSKALTRVLADDPFDGAASLDLDRWLQREHLLGPVAVPPPLCELLEVAPVTIAWLDELVSNPLLLREFGADAVAAGVRDLVVLTPHTADIAELIRLVENDEYASGAELSVRVISEPLTPPAVRLMASLSSSALTSVPRPAPYAGLPPHPAAGRVGAI